MAYTDHPGCALCDCPIVNAQSSAPDAPWRSCDCRCHDTAKLMLRDGPPRRLNIVKEAT